MQGESDVVLDDVAAMIGCTRTSLHVVASDKGAEICFFDTVYSLPRVCFTGSELQAL
jgi:hypothetical protein